MSSETFRQFYKLVEDRTGIFLDTTKQYLVESRLADLADQHRYPSVTDFISMLVYTPTGHVHHQAFEALTTHETMFFRDRWFFDALAQKILPDIMAREAGNKTLRICCAAVSTGQEAYSLAILLQEHFPQLADWDVYIQATDISAAVLDKARAGIYSSTEVSRGLDASLLSKYFLKIEKQRYQIIPSVRARISFIQSNLLQTTPQYPKFNLILLRNVLIYFLPETKKIVLDRIQKQLQHPGGLLILGSTESIVGNSAFKQVQHGKVSCYTHA
jgi:chemotaxis protein methyltransferase CheR